MLDLIRFTPDPGLNLNLAVPLLSGAGKGAAIKAAPVVSRWTMPRRRGVRSLSGLRGFDNSVLFDRKFFDYVERSTSVPKSDSAQGLDKDTWGSLDRDCITRVDGYALRDLVQLHDI